MHGGWPDIVVSGANFGPNLGQASAHHSGTVAAAHAAHYVGLPAIAISTGIDVRERDTNPPFKSTLDAFDYSGKLVVKLLEGLIRPGACGSVLPEGTALNINVPVPASAVNGIRYAPLSDSSLFRIRWQRDESGSVRIGFAPAAPGEIDAGDDADLHSKGFVTVTPINSDISIEALPATVGLPDRLPQILPGD